MTRFEKIKKMSMQELEYLVEQIGCGMCRCRDTMQEWLENTQDAINAMRLTLRQLKNLLDILQAKHENKINRQKELIKELIEALSEVGGHFKDYMPEGHYYSEDEIKQYGELINKANELIE